MRTLAQYLLPHRIIAKIAELSANCEIKLVKNYLINYFIQRYAVNMQEAVEPNPFAYVSYNKFFTRKLRPECRPIDDNANSIISPADGTMAQIGNIVDQQIIQAKGHNYSLAGLLANDPCYKDFINGKFATIYLAPKDYHRVHMPLNGKLKKMWYVPGKLFSVNKHAAENIPSVFARNERIIALFDTQAGQMAVILVGAMIVGSMEMIWASQITPPHSKQINTWHYTGESAINIAKGDEIGLFKLGSTVIVLFTAQANNWDIDIDSDVKMGAKIGFINI